MVLVLVVAVVFALAPSRPGNGLLPQAPIVLWAWDRPEDLRFIDPLQVAVASLTGTVRLRADHVDVRARPHLLATPVGTALISVVRIESDPLLRPRLATAQREAAADAIVALVGSTARHAQLDFDATRSERAFYRALLADLRVRLPPRATLSITALASWCFGDRWLDELPIDFAVPMLFRMGPDAAAIRQTLADGRDFRSGMCRHVVGVSLDEPIPRLPPGRPVYVFNPRPWSTMRYQNAVALIGGIAG